MKKLVAFLISSIFSICSHLNAQKILLKIASITDPAGEEVRAVDFKVDAVTTWASGGGVSVGAPKVHDILIKKTNNTSTNAIYKKLLQGAITPIVILEYYDASNLLYFQITLKSVYVSNFYWLSPECPTCLKLEHQIAFVPKQVETYDVASGITVGFDVTTRLTY